MRLRIFVLAGLFIMAGTIQLHAGDQKVFGDWTVEIEIDEFDQKVKATLNADIRSRTGEHIGVLSFQPSIFGGRFFHSLLSFSGADGASSFQRLYVSFPDCDYEFVRYRIDAGETHHLPTFRHACKHPILDAGMVAKFKAGITFEFVVKEHIGVVSLRGFAAAWNYAMSRIK